MLNVIMMNVIATSMMAFCIKYKIILRLWFDLLNAECHYDECHYAECWVAIESTVSFVETASCLQV